ncbi:3-dehydroquinate synthase [Desulfococcus sp.]|uniref:3-dehydroquinate synthase n=1 Tax=Desulfococcus sp. TaxID=2025834 RepID=UPI003D14CFDF
MKTLHIHGSTGDSTLRVGESFSHLDQYVPVDRTVIITDPAVRALYGDRFPDCPIIEIGIGERNKTLKTVEFIYERLIKIAADRSTWIVGIGGGIVCDVSGFAASTYLRGVQFGFAPSTLLAQVDAGVGGKNGVNFAGYKNMVGTFNQPAFVICDMEMLKTLSRADLLCGFAEIVKHGAIADPALFRYVEDRRQDALALEPAVVERMVYDAVVVKANIVNQDEREGGVRRKLNFGHTFGHAVEKVTGVPHGEAVSIGMAVAGLLSVRRGYLGQTDLQRLTDLLEALGLPTRLDVDPQQALDALKRDKKRSGDHIKFVLLKAVGEAVVEDIRISELEEVLHERSRD